jgi:hypothetical protein
VSVDPDFIYLVVGALFGLVAAWWLIGLLRDDSDLPAVIAGLIILLWIVTVVTLWPVFVIAAGIGWCVKREAGEWTR